MKSELASVYSAWPEGTLVPSLYNSYIKPAAVDESTLAGLFDDMGLDDEVTRRSILALVESRPVNYDRKEMGYILSKGFLAPVGFGLGNIQNLPSCGRFSFVSKKRGRDWIS